MPAEHDEPLWARIARPPSAPRQALSPLRIASVAVGIADSEGLDAITMRRLATELGVAPMAAYRYVSGKSDVLALMVDQVYGEHLPPEGDNWRDVAHSCAVNVRAMVLKHPWLMHLPSDPHLVLTPNRLAVTERSLRAFEGLGLTTDTTMAVFRTVTAYAHGILQIEISQQALMQHEGWTTGDEMRHGLAPAMTWFMNTGRYPALLRYAREATRKDDTDWQFETGLEYVISGIATQLNI
ncbi:Tetracyclin repressor, C-terminal all-alpha domain [Sinosporangium album]|uniref:Tetracyclin repressor, C-terminal all-alpha domain n=1 Tax=Sinosporangium album TaxID=504805 RepID=A0A1G8GBQ4_9ACTN|nr:TetR/AcrR family transcriptional regulator [Sinosporangium album]SDH91731.1 Tetracyclin repressor, C-terminal all-alpha domain [Sinosporangium album]